MRFPHLRRSAYAGLLRGGGRLVGGGHLADEEWLHGGLWRPAGRLFTHGGDLELEVRWERQLGHEPSIRTRVEGADAHRLTLGDGPQLIRPAGGRGRKVENGHHDPAPGGAPEQPGGRRLPGRGEGRRGCVGREQRRHERVAGGDRIAARRERRAHPLEGGALPQVRVAHADDEDEAGRGGKPGPDVRPEGWACTDRPDAARLSKHALAQGGWWRRGGRRLCEQPGDLAERLHFPAALGASGEVYLEPRTLFGVEGAERVRRRELSPLVIGHDAPPTSSGASEPRSFSIAARMRVLTVPSGSCSSAAISVWLRPPKYASSITRRCGSGSSPSERATRRRAS